MNEEDLRIIEDFFNDDEQGEWFTSILEAVIGISPLYSARFNGNVLGISVGENRYIMYVVKDRHCYKMKIAGIAGTRVFDRASDLDELTSYVLRNVVVPDTPAPEMEEYDLDYNDLVYFSTDYDDINEIRVKGHFNVIKPSGKLSTVEKIIKMDSLGNFYIRDTVYDDVIKRFGVPCITLIVPEIATRRDHYSYDYFECLSPESQLRMKGYTTRTDYSLTDVQRQAILCNAVENGLWSVRRCISHLQWCIEKHPQAMYSHNRDKWNKDIQFLIDSYTDADDFIIRI